MTDETTPDQITATSDPAETGDRREGETLGATPDAQTSDPALERDPSEWVSGDDPITEAQKSYLDNLARQAGEELPADMSKAEASQHIDRLKTQLDL